MDNPRITLLVLAAAGLAAKPKPAAPLPPPPGAANGAVAALPPLHMAPARVSLVPQEAASNEAILGGIVEFLKNKPGQKGGHAGRWGRRRWLSG